MDNSTQTLPKGEYYIGDLCYVMTDSEWSEVCKLTIKGRECLSGVFTLPDGRKFAMYGTAYGDGTYQSNENTFHSVDSGTIGCILKSDIAANKYIPEHIEELGCFKMFSKDVTTGSDGSTIYFNDFTIDTDPIDEDEEEEDDY